MVRRMRLMWYFAMRLILANVMSSTIATALWSSANALLRGKNVVRQAVSLWVVVGLTFGFATAVILQVRNRSEEFHLYRSYGLEPWMCVAGGFVVHCVLFSAVGSTVIRLMAK